jgi:hypothetical protein
MDDAYATGEARRYLSLSDVALDGVEKLSLAGLADWAQQRTGEVQ